ncbi:hypothetical protein BDV25DRAFT_170903 [Aspergillus avenaceus]|uniref:Fungal-specific transcription factor domain-containing protein n=1 Tax=Aspergillus avenaceus TaxID=36643 RepID=A0A5N6TF07_ASPAV|nr:hypothetical protein BDV25DRAFT_170903 [Aspergillus avenaceus]
MARQRLPDARFINDRLWPYYNKSSQRQDVPQSIWCQKNIQEACLMRWFVEELAQWFDTCASSKPFSHVVPQRAEACPALLYAILSASARHLSRVQSTRAGEILCSGKKLPHLGDGVALEYQSLCISQLRSLSGDPSNVQDENLLAAAVILRFYEEVDSPLVGVDDETYLRGVQVFLHAQSATAMRDGGLRLAAFWVGIRQEFHTSFIRQRAFQFDLSCCDNTIYRFLTRSDDPTWANRAILHCADVLTYCFGNKKQPIEIYQQLWEFSQNWQLLVPSSFHPIYCREADQSKNQVFPEVWYLNDCSVTAIQHWHLARILLHAFDPRVPRVGLGRKKAVAQRDAEIIQSLFILCGIALSNRTAPALITACMGVSMCGDRVTDRLTQEALLMILIRTEDLHALSTVKTQMELQEAWGWTID